LPKNKALIKYLSEEGIRNILNKTENNYLQDQAKEMPFVDTELYFTIEEKQNQIEMTDKGLEMITAEGEDKDFFIMPDIGMEMASIENSDLSDREKLEQKDKLILDFSVKSERIHAIQQLLKAYCMFEIDVEYVVIDGKVIKVFAEKDPLQLPWASLDIDFVLEATGVFRTYEKAALHLEAGAKRVMLSAPPKGPGVNAYVLGVNEEEMHAEELIISNASCTTNSCAHIVKHSINKISKENVK